MKNQYQFFVYIMGSISGVLYVGISRSTEGRTWQHKIGKGAAFTKKYKCLKLLYYEEHQYIYNAIAREKQIKNWRREKKIALIKILNPNMIDLAFDWEYCKRDGDFYHGSLHSPTSTHPAAQSG